MPSLKMEELKMPPSLHNAMEDEMALMPSGEYDGAGKHTLFDHLAHPMKGFGDYLHALEGGMKTGKYEGEGATPSMGLSQFRGGMEHGDDGYSTPPRRPGPYRGPVFTAAERTELRRKAVLEAVEAIRAAEEARHRLRTDTTLTRPVRARINGVIAALDKYDKDIMAEAEAVVGMMRLRGGMAVGQVVGSGKLTITHGDDSASASDEEMEGCGPAPAPPAPAGKKKRAPAGPDDGRRKRAAVVRKVMADKGLSMIEASKYVKAHGLYKP